MTEPYHRFVYDEDRRVLVGEFEEMYRQEIVEGFDSWHQEDLSPNWRGLVLALICAHEPRSILDVGCGKGVFTARFCADRILGLDVSETALAKARERVPHGEFRRLRAEEIDSIGEHFDLAVCLEMLSYVQEWRRFLDELSTVARRLVVSLYLPPTPPIGYITSFDELREGIGQQWKIETEALVVDASVGGSQLLVLAEARPR
jgi:ubiquinone/menaquinone biosynthesis C-methylase UbiE